MRSDELENQQYLGRSEMSEMDYMRQELVRLQEQVTAQDADLQKLRQQLSLPGAASANAGQPNLTSRRTMLRRVGSAAAGIAALSLAAGLNPAAALADEPAIDADGTGGATPSYGGQFKGDLAQLRLVPATTAGGRTAGTHVAGELYADSDNNLYYYNGTSWNQLNNQVTYLASPLRLIGDPNTVNTTFPLIAGGTSASYQVAGIQISNTGSQVTATIPTNAVSVLGTLVILSPQGGGFATIYPAGATRPVVASVVYSAGVSTSTMVSVKLGPVNGNAATPGVTIFSNQSCNIAFDIIAYTM
jgi:hypothetical protein